MRASYLYGHDFEDYQLPTDTALLYYKVVPINKDGIAGVASPVGSVDITYWQQYWKERGVPR